MMLADAADPLHEAARGARDAWLEGHGVLVSTDFVMDETLTLLRFRLGLPAAESWWQQVDESALVRWERIDAERSRKAREWFFRWREQDFSFTDCSSFVVMRELRLKTALSSDDHFRRALFTILPEVQP
jgi:hypothetical protein